MRLAHLSTFLIGNLWKHFRRKNSYWDDICRLLFFLMLFVISHMFKQKTENTMNWIEQRGDGIRCHSYTIVYSYFFFFVHRKSFILRDVRDFYSYYSDVTESHLLNMTNTFNCSFGLPLFGSDKNEIHNLHTIQRLDRSSCFNAYLLYLFAKTPSIHILCTFHFDFGFRKVYPFFLVLGLCACINTLIYYELGCYLTCKSLFKNVHT